MSKFLVKEEIKKNASQVSKISKQQQPLTKPTLTKGATSTPSLDEQEASFESVFVETKKASVVPGSTGKSGNKPEF